MNTRPAESKNSIMLGEFNLHQSSTAEARTTPEKKYESLVGLNKGYNLHCYKDTLDLVAT